MQEIKYTYNSEKENAVFAVKLRGLFNDRKKTHRELAEYIEKVTGESVTRQAIGQWCNGNTCPNLKTVPIIAEFFGVSCDYLLTNTEIETTDADLIAACKYTGLSQSAVKTLARDFTLNGRHVSPNEPLAEAIKSWAEMANRIIEGSFLTYFAIKISDLTNTSEYVSHTYVNLTPMEILRLEEELNIRPNALSDLLYEKMHEYIENAPKPPESEADDPYTMDEKCDVHRYKLIKMTENISNLFDRRNDWRNCNHEQLLEYLNITEEELKELQAR